MSGKRSQLHASTTLHSQGRRVLFSLSSPCLMAVILNERTSSGPWSRDSTTMQNQRNLLEYSCPVMLYLVTIFWRDSATIPAPNASRTYGTIELLNSQPTERAGLGSEWMYKRPELLLLPFWFALAIVPKHYAVPRGI